MTGDSFVYLDAIEEFDIDPARLEQLPVETRG